MLCVAVLSLAPSAALAQACAGDCDGDQVVEVDELITGVDAALRVPAPSRCAHFDPNGDGVVAVDELIQAVASALEGCPDAVTVRGVCSRPGPSGLEACVPRTLVRAVQCANPRHCVQEQRGEAALLASARVAGNGEFTLVLDRRRTGEVPIVLDGEVDAGTPYRSIGLASESSVNEARGLAGAENERLDPMSEATARLIDERGLENFDSDGIGLVEVAVRVANSGETFAGLSAAAAADRATVVARGDPAVAAAIEESFARADVTLHIASAAAAAGTTAELSVSLAAAGQAVVATENLISYDPSTPIAAAPDGAPECAVNPSIRKDGTVFSFQPANCTPGVDCAAVKAFVVALDDVRPIADGAVLYTCDVEVSADLLAGDVRALLCSAAHYSGPDGPIPAPVASCTNGEVAVVAP